MNNQSNPILTDNTATKQAKNNQSNKSIFDYSLCDSSFNKDCPYATKFEPKQGTVEDLAQYVQQGKAFSSGIFKNDYRNKVNAQGFQTLVGDIDDTWSLDYIQQQDFVKDNVALIYTSHSHQKEVKDSGEKIEPCDRYRIVIPLPEYIDDPKLFPYLWNIVKEQIPPMDLKCKDVSRQYYGFNKTQIVKCDKSLVLDEKYIEEAKKRKLNDELDKALKPYERASKIKYDYDPQKTESKVKEALRYIPTRQPGTGDYPEKFAVLCALTNEFGKSKAKELANQWSPTIEGSSWNPDYKIDTINRDGITIGSLFFIAEQYGFKMPKKETSKSTGHGVGVNTLEKNDVITLIDKVINDGVHGSELTVKLKELEEHTGWKKYDLDKLYGQRLEEREFEENKEELKQELNKLLNVGTQTVKIDDIFDENLAKGLKHKANLIGINEEAYITTILPVIGSQVPIGNELKLIDATDFTVKPIIWTGLVGLAGTIKSNTQETIIEPLYDIQQELKEQHQKEIEQWKQECSEDKPKPPKPKMKKAFVTDTTLEGLAKTQANQLDRGILIHKDELAGFFKGLNKYNNGDDLEQFLSLRFGSPLNVSRSDSEKEVFVRNPSISLTGSIQPDALNSVIQKLGGFNDDNGMIGRFLFGELIDESKPLTTNMIKVEVKDVLLDLYKKLRNLNVTQYKLSDSAFEHYISWYNELKLAIKHETDNGYRNVMSKMLGTTGTIALLLHLTNACLRDETPDQKVSLDTLKSAIKLSSYYIDQYRSFRLKNEELQKNDENALPPLLKTIVECSDKKGWLTGRDVRNSTSKFKKVAMTEIRSYFIQLEELGYGFTEGEGNKMRYKNLDHNDHNDHKNSNPPSSGNPSCGQDNHKNDHKNKMTTKDDHNSDITTEGQKTENCGQSQTVVKTVVKNNENDHKVKSNHNGTSDDFVGNVVNVVNSQPQQHGDDQKSKLIQKIKSKQYDLMDIYDYSEDKFDPDSHLEELNQYLLDQKLKKYDSWLKQEANKLDIF